MRRFDQAWPWATRGHKPRLPEKPTELLKFERRCEKFYRSRVIKRVRSFDFTCAGFAIHAGQVFYGEDWGHALDWKSMDGDRQHRVLELLPMMEEYLSRQEQYRKERKGNG